ncbi:hypothetical protein GCM10019016_041260 [Streptomyces prasinosporus]|uniref:Nudix hydrolase domain-containing protein n=1 Tax=Streptomyces prasinosporus TaxID=68256 RepID=A0ABP6TQC4_9ACTN
MDGYAKHAFEPFAVTVDLAVFTIRAGALHVLLVERGQEPYAGRWALPGGFVRPDESAEGAARRELGEETGLTDVSGLHLEQLRTYSEPGRDPRMRVVSVAFAALLPDAPEACGGGDAARARWTPYDRARELAFDHDRIVADARERVGAKLEYTCLATAFCPPEFTLGELQQVYETVWGATLDRPQLPAQGARHPRLRRSRARRRAPHRRPGQARRALPRGHRRRPPPAAAPADPGRTSRMTTTTVTKRAATGALTGLALGDALGFPDRVQRRPRRSSPSADPGGRWTCPGRRSSPTTPR